ncbi:PilW family protein [Thiobacillus sp.]|uniref:PilW family protein n=1 Tax=Thiobacillus sp. TaxID=924 RepID=UPI0025DE05BA|nr:PilW family protein [Thiobacillus sp.]
MSGLAFIECNARGRIQQKGFTLVELLIAMTLGLVILLAIGSIYIGSRATFRMQDDNARLQETGRYALEVFGRSIRQAGFWNMPISPVSKATGFGGTAITGVDGAAGAPDTVTVQYDGLTGDRDCEGNVLAANAVVQDDYRLSGNDLQCDGNADGTVDYQTLVSDIEDVQVLYGIHASGGSDQSVEQYVAAPADWGQVYSVRVCVQARSANSVNNAPQRYLNCGGALGTATGAAAFTTAGANDLRLRRVFVATYSLRNRVTNVP